MAKPVYEPIPVEVTMSQYGYWVVTISVSPYQRMAVMICQVGITPDQALAAGLSSVTPALGGK